MEKEKIKTIKWDIPRDAKGRFKKGESRGECPRETRLKIGESNKRVFNDPVWKEKIGVIKSKKAGETLKINYQSGKVIHPRGMLGKENKWGKHSEKAIKIMSMTWFKKGNKPKTKDKTYEEIYGKKDSEIKKKKIKISRANQLLPLKDTSIEVKVQNFLKQLGIEFFTHQYIKEIEHGYQCDILIPSMNMVIECDGTYWHKYPIGNDIDHIRTKELIEKGFKVLRLWEFEINDMTIDKFKERLDGIYRS